MTMKKKDLEARVLQLESDVAALSKQCVTAAKLQLESALLAKDLGRHLRNVVDRVNDLELANELHNEATFKVGQELANRLRAAAKPPVWTEPTTFTEAELKRVEL